MKLRIKYLDKRLTIDINENEDVATLMVKCQDIAPPGVWFLSMNNHEPILEHTKSLASLGLVSGDLLYIILPAEDLESTLINLGFKRDDIHKVLNTFGAKNLDDALELLAMLNDSKPQSSSISSSTINQTLVKSSRKSEEIKKPIKGAAVEDTKPIKQISHPQKTVQLSSHDSFIEAINALLKEENCETNADFLCLALHVLMSISGFLILPTTSNAKDQQQVVKPPFGWKDSLKGFYRLNYVHCLSEDISCCISCTVFGQAIVASGTLLNADDANVYQTKLIISEYVNEINGAGWELKNISSFLHRVKNHIVVRLCKDIRSKCGIEEELSLDTLPVEIQQRLVYYFDYSTLGRMCCVNQKWNSLCSDENVWKAVYCSLFGREKLINCDGSYKNGVKHLITRQQQERLEQLERLERQKKYEDFLRAKEFQPEFGADVLHYPSPIVPGIIGGARDLYPSSGFLPCIPGSSPKPHGLFNPAGSRIGYRPPGARFDPYGPLTGEDEYHNSRRPHPDLFQPPRFRGDRFDDGRFI